MRGRNKLISKDREIHKEIERVGKIDSVCVREIDI